MKPRPNIYEDILIFRSGATPRIGGHFAQPDLGLSYLLAARHVIEAGEAEGRLAEVALPVAYLQRHSMEIVMKNLLAIVYGLHADRTWLDALMRDPNADRPALERPPREHHFERLRGVVCRALKKLDFELPEEIAEMASKLAQADDSDPTRFRYLTRSNGKESFPKLEVLPVVERQEELEAMFEKHLRFEGFDGPPAERNLATELAAVGGYLFQQITSIVPLERL